MVGAFPELEEEVKLSRDFNQLDVKRLDFVSKHEDAACDTFSAPFH